MLYYDLNKPYDLFSIDGFKYISAHKKAIINNCAGFMEVKYDAQHKLSSSGFRLLVKCIPHKFYKIVIEAYLHPPNFDNWISCTQITSAHTKSGNSLYHGEFAASAPVYKNDIAVTNLDLNTLDQMSLLQPISTFTQSNIASLDSGSVYSHNTQHSRNIIMNHIKDKTGVQKNRKAEYDLKNAEYIEYVGMELSHSPSNPSSFLNYKEVPAKQKAFIYCESQNIRIIPRIHYFYPGKEDRIELQYEAPTELLYIGVLFYTEHHNYLLEITEFTVNMLT